MKNSDLLIKFKEQPIKNIGIKPENKTLSQLLNSGIINIDKDAGPTSHQSCDYLKKILNIDKAGHSGTLDPQVTGVLLIGLGKGTKIMEYMLKSNKEYVCLMYLHKPIDTETIKKTFQKFTGTIKQIPPIISAVKRQERERTIYYNNILEIDKTNQYILFRVGCQHGTYIRKLCTDMAQDMGVNGQMIELRRTKAGPLTEQDSIISLDKLRNLYALYNNTENKKEKAIYENELKKYIKPLEHALKDFKKVYVRNSAVNSITHGSDLAIPGVSMLDKDIKIGEEVALLTLKGEIIAMGTAYLTSKEVMKKKKGAFIKTNKVLMEQNLYPKTWDFK